MIDVKAFVDTLLGKPVAVFGLGLSGIATVRALISAGATVFAWDDKAPARGDAEKLGAQVMPLDTAVLSSCACMVLAPGVPLHLPEPHEVVLAARKAGIEIIGDLEILGRLGHGRKVIGITGTNGKSTTTALIAHILSSAGKSVAMGGNIGKAVLDLEMPEEDGLFVIEISSYQMDLCPTFRPDISVLLNITPDHIDRHGSIEGYAAAKEKMFEGAGVAIVGVDDVPSLAIYERILAFETGQRTGVAVSCLREIDPGVYVIDGQLHDKTSAQFVAPQSLNGIATLAGVHNHQNASIAYAVCRVLGLEADEILRHIKTYSGLPHRQLTVRTINGVAYINDSKATNAVSAEKALLAYNNIYWIVGGRPKAGGLNGLENAIAHVKCAFVIGEAMVDFSEWLVKHSIPHENSGTLEAALLAAHRAAQASRGQPGGAGVVLLAPACSSFDQFRSFEERGDVFCKLVETLSAEGDAA